MDTKSIWLVTGNRRTGEKEVTTLDQWMRVDSDLWCKRSFDAPVLEWLILSAHQDSESARREAEEP